MDKIKEKIRHIKAQEKFPDVQEEKFLQTVSVSKQALYESICQETISYFDFLHMQARFIKKRWWLLQTAVLLFLWGNSFITQSYTTFYSNTAILIPVFVILIIPELWRSVHTKSWEVENSSFYTLRQIYSARLLLFGIVDLLMLSTFFAAASITLQISIYDIIIHCVLPFNITCCICFGILCSKRFCSEYIAISFCMIEAVIWHQIIINQKLYESVSEVIWLAGLCLSFIYLVFVIRRVIKTCSEKCEVNILWS